MKSSIVLTGLLALSVAAHADLLKVAVNGGYSTVTMADYNSAIDKAKQSNSGSTSTPYGGGWFVGAEAGIGLMPFLELGPRVEYLQASQASLSSPSFKYTLDSSLTSFMVGPTVSMDLPLTGLGFNAGAYGGYGYAVTKISNTPTGGTAIGSQSTGGAFVGELEAKLKYSVMPLVSVDLLAGLRFANMGNLKDGDTADKNASDFSGLNAGGGLSIGF